MRTCESGLDSCVGAWKNPKQRELKVSEGKVGTFQIQERCMEKSQVKGIESLGFAEALEPK
jgi:hypothetical protein